MKAFWFHFAVLILWPTWGWACAVCYGNPDHPMSKGLTMGVVALLALIVAVLVGFGAFFLFLRARLKKWGDTL